MKTFLVFKKTELGYGEKVLTYQDEQMDESSAKRSSQYSSDFCSHFELLEGMDADVVRPVFIEEVVGVEAVEAVEAQPEKWIKEGEQDVFIDPQDPSWAYVAAIEAVEGVEGIEAVAAHWELQNDAALVAAKQAYVALAPKRAAEAAIQNAMNYGQQVMKEFAGENVLLGITQDGMTGTVRKNMSEVILALTTGSLYDAIDEARAIPEIQKDVKYITNARLLAFINKIESYLGVPLSESL
jgi:hypothetical protein